MTEQQKRAAYVTISIELAEMFEKVSRNWARRGEREKVKLIAKVEKEICGSWKNYQRAPKNLSDC